MSFSLFRSWNPPGDEPEDAEFEAPKVYEPIPSFDGLNERLNMFLSMYNESVRGGRMDLVFFKVRKQLHPCRVYARVAVGCSSCEYRALVVMSS